MHDLLRDLCIREAEKEKFYHVVGAGQHLNLEGARSQRRIVIMGSASKKEARETLESMPHARSYICDNDRVGMLPSSRLLRTFKAYRKDNEMVSPFHQVLRLMGSAYGIFYRDHKFGREKYSLRKMFELVNLRYLVVEAKWHGKFPSSVGLLWNLQTLVVAHSGKLEAPVEIWKMPQLRHLHFCQLSVFGADLRKGSMNLPDPPRDDVIMENLQTLTGVRNLKFSEEVIRRIPNIKKLGIYYELMMGNGPSLVDYYCLANLECLRKLESLSCKCHWLQGLQQKFPFPLSLRKLNLDSILLCSEDIMGNVGSLPLLQKLKLIGGVTFETGKWEIVEGQFRSLKSLSLVGAAGLKQWVMEEGSHFPCLEQLRLFGVDELEEIPAEIGEIPTLQSIQLLSCSATVVKSAHKIVEQQQELQCDQLSFHVCILKDPSVKLEILPNPNIHFY